MPRYAAIDIGSNSVRMQVAEIGPAQPLSVLAADREVTRLGSSVFRDGRISEQAMDTVTAVLARFAAAWQPFDVAGVRAVATSAVRDASNQHEFIDRASEAARAPVEIISGTEEARLIQLGVHARWPQPGKRLLTVDVGGGSAEIIHSIDGHMVDGVSRPLGAVRLTEVFLKDDPPTDGQLRNLHRFVEEKLSVAVKRMRGETFDRVIATSATAAALVCAINRVPRPKREMADRLRASLPQLRRLYSELSARPVQGRRKIAGIGPRRAEIIVPGAAVFVQALEAFGMNSLYYCIAGVRDGIIADLDARGVGRELSRLSREQLQVVEVMARKYGVAVRHARKVASLAHTLFDCLQPLHKLPPDYGKILEAACWLHDIGHFVSDTGHHKHSLYLVMNSDLPGFTDRERIFIALLCRYHRKTMPNGRHMAYQSLNADSKRAIALLTPLLRVADALDSSKEQTVEDIDVVLKNGSVQVKVAAAGDANLELWAAARAADTFRSVYERPLVLAAAKGAGR